MSEDPGMNGQNQAVAEDPLGPPPTPMPRAVVCPYCGHISGSAERCSGCGGRFDPLSRQATQNAMGPWFVLDPRSPTRPGCTFDTILQLADKGTIRPDSVVRSPTTRQFWMLAKRVPGLGNRFGVCHSCQAEVEPSDYMCDGCGAVFEVDRDRQHLGVGPVRLLAGQAAPDRIAATDHGPRAMPAPAGGPRVEAGVSRPAEGATTDDAARASRLERRLRAQTARLRASGVVSVVAVLALVATIAIEQLDLGAGSPAVSGAGPGLVDEQPRAIESISGGAMRAGADDERVIDDREGSIAAVQPPSAVEPTEMTWEQVRARAVDLYKSGRTQDLEAAIELLEGFVETDGAPAEAGELRDTLAERLRQKKLDGLP